MASLKITLDKRRAKRDGTYPLKLSISHKQKTAYISLDIALKPNQWDERTQTVIDHPNKKFFRTYLSRKLLDAEQYILEMNTSSLKVDACAIRDYILAKFNPLSTKALFKDYANKFISLRKGGTRHNYEVMLLYVKEFCELNSMSYDTLSFDELNKDWYRRYDEYLSSKLKENTQATTYKLFSAILNSALDDKIISNTDHKKIKHKAYKTRSRALELDDLRTAMSATYPTEEGQRAYDMFKLSFFLIGINIKDMCYLKHDSVSHGRISYRRAKTSKDYSIRIEPEAQVLLDKYKGTDYLLNLVQKGVNYEKFTTKFNYYLRHLKLKHDKRISTYWARHSWATIAHQIGIPKDTISMCLGHSFGVAITDVYIDYSYDLIDEANRKVLDFVLYNKK